MGAKKISLSSKHQPRRSLVCVASGPCHSQHAPVWRGGADDGDLRWTINPQELHRQHRRSVGSQSTSARARHRCGGRRRLLSIFSCLSTQMWPRRLGKTDLRRGLV